jgi:hypothetical protein
MLGSCTYGAANMAASYNGGGKSDWFLPSKDELNQLYLARTSVGGFGASAYWPSSEYVSNSTWAWEQMFTNGVQDANVKSFTTYVRPIRAF